MRLLLLTCSVLAGWLGCWAEAPAGGVATPDETTLNAEASDQGYVVEFWHREYDGLPDNTINALLQTRDGFMWIGTSAGLVIRRSEVYCFWPEGPVGHRST